MSCESIASPSPARKVVLAVVVALGVTVAAPVAAASKPRVEEVAVEAVELHGDGAPLAVLAAYDAGANLREIVQEIDAGTLPPAPDAAGTPNTAASAARGPALGRSAPLQAQEPPSQADMFAVMQAINEGTFGALTGTSIFTPTESTELRTEAAKEQTDPKAPVADPRALAREARKAQVDAATAAFTVGILLAARNGYSPGQIHDAILDTLLVPPSEQFGESDPFVPFLLAGIIPGVDPEFGSIAGVLAGGPKVTEASSKLPKSEPIEPGVTLEFRGTGTITTFVNTDTPQTCEDAAAKILVTVDAAGNLSGTADGRTTTLENSCEKESGPALVFYASGPPPSECEKVCRYKPDRYFQGTIVFNGEAMDVDIADTSSGFQQATIRFRIERKQ